MDLVAVDDRLALLHGGHKRGEAADLARGVSDEQVAQVRLAHLPAFGLGVPPARGGGVVGAAGLLDEKEAGLEVVCAGLEGLAEGQAVDGVGGGVLP